MLRPVVLVTVLMVWCAMHALMTAAGATLLELVELTSASQRLISGALIPGDPIQGTLAKPEGSGRFPAVIVMHGCAGMHDTTKEKLVGALVPQGYVILLVDSYTTRGIEHACTSSAFATFAKRKQDAFGAHHFLARQTFVDPQRLALVGFSAGAWVTLSVAEPNASDNFDPQSSSKFRAAIAFYPPCQVAGARPAIPTLIFTGALDRWTPAEDCSKRVVNWGNVGPPIELIVFADAFHGFFYPHLQPGRTVFGHWLEYNSEAANNAIDHVRRFLDRHLQ